MKTLRCLISISCFLVLFTSNGLAETPKWATVDMQRLFKDYHRTISAQKLFNKEYARIQKGVNERSEAAHRVRQRMAVIQKELQAKDITDEQKNVKVQEMQMLGQELNMIDRSVRAYSAQEKQKIARQKASSMQGIMTEIKQRVAEHAEKNGFDYVFDKSGKNTNQITFFIFLKDAADITPVMLKELNKDAANGK